MLVHPRLRRHLPLTLLLGALVAWPMIHHAPPATCPPGVTACPLDTTKALAGGSQLVVVHRPQ